MVCGFSFSFSDLQLRREIALLDRIRVPVGKIMLFGRFRPDIALHACLFETLHDLLLL